jgi:CHRD domain
MKNKFGRNALLLFAAALLTITINSSVTLAQNSTAQDEILTAKLTSFSQVPSVLAASTGSFEAKVNPADQTITFTLSYANMSSNVVQAHIHFGASKTNGGVMVFLCGGLSPNVCPASGSITGTLTAQDVSLLPVTNPDSVIPQGIQPMDFAGMVKAINAGKAYVNVHTVNFPNGELRGQIKVQN